MGLFFVCNDGKELDGGEERYVPNNSDVFMVDSLIAIAWHSNTFLV